MPELFISQFHEIQSPPLYATQAYTRSPVALSYTLFLSLYTLSYATLTGTRSPELGPIYSILLYTI